jgi:hypothetical protein
MSMTQHVGCPEKALGQRGMDLGTGGVQSPAAAMDDASRRGGFIGLRRRSPAGRPG